MTDAPALDPPAFTPPSRCGRCGYATHGLPTAICPECGFDLTRTPYLRFADRGWLQMIVLGTTLVRVGAIGAIVTVFAGSGILDWIKSLGVPLPASTRRMAVVIRFLFLALAAGGAWLMAAPDPSLGDELGPGARRRRYFRIGIALAMALAMARVVFGPWLPPLGAAGLSVAALICTLRSVRGLGDVVRELVARSETAPVDAASDAGRGGAWVYWALGAVSLLGIVALRRGPAAAALPIESGVIGLGVVGAGFALYSLVKSSRAIHDELAKAPRDQV